MYDFEMLYGLACSWIDHAKGQPGRMAGQQQIRLMRNAQCELGAIRNIWDQLHPAAWTDAGLVGSHIAVHWADPFVLSQCRPSREERQQTSTAGQPTTARDSASAWRLRSPALFSFSRQTACWASYSYRTRRRRSRSSSHPNFDRPTLLPSWRRDCSGC